MNFKPIYVYPAIVLVAISAIIVFLILDKEKASQSLTENKSHSQKNVSPEAIKMLAELKAKFEANQGDTLVVREYADFLAKGHDQDQAIELYKRILNEDPKRLDILFSIATLYFHTQKLDEAEIYVNKILTFDQNNTLALFNKGVLEYNFNRVDAAKTIWEDIVKRFPTSPEAELAKKELEFLKSE